MESSNEGNDRRDYKEKKESDGDNEEVYIYKMGESQKQDKLEIGNYM